MALGDVFYVDVMDDYMVSFIDSNRIWHECVVGYVVESRLAEGQGAVKEIECSGCGGGIMYYVSNAQAHDGTARYGDESCCCKQSCRSELPESPSGHEQPSSHLASPRTSSGLISRPSPLPPPRT